jgi:DNA modification methylase
LEFSNVHHGDEGFHPTQKPVELLRYLIRTYTDEGQVILDNCMGSGTTAVAALLEHRHFIGFELDKDYYDKAIDRIAKIKAEPSLDFK